MFVRLAVEADFPAVIDLARMNAEETRPEYPFSADRVAQTCAKYIDDANPILYVVEEGREVIGLLLMRVLELGFTDGLCSSQEVMFVRPDRRGTRAAVMLVRTLISESRRLGVLEVIGGNDNKFNSERTAKFLEHFGFERVGYSLRMML
jgi:L-amino acid N-acyltransferase YncA